MDTRKVTLRLELNPGDSLAGLLRAYAEMVDALRDETEPLRFLEREEDEPARED